MIDFTGTNGTKTAFVKYKFYKRLGRFELREKGGTVESVLCHQAVGVWKRDTTWQQVEKLRALGITHIINLRWSQSNAKVCQFPHIWLRFHDDKKPRPQWFYRKALKFYRKATNDSRAKVFVMCHHGQSRSASLAYFILRVSGKSPRKAERRVLNARSTARVVPAYRESGEDFADSYDSRKP